MSCLTLLLIQLLSPLSLKAINGLPSPSAAAVSFEPFKSSEQRSNENCGLGFNAAKLSQAKFGHEYAEQGDAPFVVQINLEDKFGSRAKCTGSLLYPSNWVLTSADCGKDALEQHSGDLAFKVSLGLDFDDFFAERKITYNVSQAVKTGSGGCELLLLELVGEIPLSRNVQTACLPNWKEEEAGKLYGADVKRGTATKSLAVGWASFDGEATMERDLRLTGVSVTKGACLSSAEAPADDMLCVKYQPQMHYSLLYGSPLVKVEGTKNQVTLQAVACAKNMSTKLIDGEYVYMQSFTRIRGHRLRSVIEIVNGLANLRNSGLKVSACFSSFLSSFALLLAFYYSSL